SRGVTPVLPAFSSWPDSYASGTDVNQGDNYLSRTAGGDTTTSCWKVEQITGGTTYDSNWETQGYRWKTSKNFAGYTRGPRYWGKTDGSALDDNTLLFKATSPGYNDPAGNYQINYAAILNWIKNTGSNPFPSQLRAGYVHYDQIPSDVPSAAYDH